MNKIIFAILLINATLFSLEVNDFTVRLSSKVDSTEKFEVTLTWVQDPDAISYTLYLENDNQFEPLAELDGSTTFYKFDNSNVFNEQSREIKVKKLFLESDTITDGWGYIDIGYNLQLKENKGRVLVCVDNYVYDSLLVELNQFKNNLNLSGYLAEIVRVPRAEYFNAKKILQTKNIIKSKYKEYNNNLNSVILIGKVPISYSGFSSPDGHSDETIGAWPGDGYYAETNSDWGDNRIDTVINTLYMKEHNNSAWDGKWDASNYPSNLEFSFGRIDMSNLSLFEESEIDLLRRYFRKNNEFRQGLIKYPFRGLLDDKWQLYSREIIGAEAWMNFSSILGDQNINATNGQFLLRNEPYLLYWGGASGGYLGVANTA
ncbi:hypothetical protein OAQ99_04440, partial [Candidatus Kapabacteria bacterium]|nr:hypothetical protein [Candidatus Kapabacteria bacterium]